MRFQGFKKIMTNCEIICHGTLFFFADKRDILYLAVQTADMGQHMEKTEKIPISIVGV